MVNGIVRRAVAAVGAALGLLRPGFTFTYALAAAVVSASTLQSEPGVAHSASSQMRLPSGSGGSGGSTGVLVPHHWYQRW